MNKINLKREDWSEIFYALESKVASAVVADDRKLTSHLDSIIKKIGPDGERAFKHGVASKTDDWWTVALVHNRENGDVCRFVKSARGNMSRAVDLVKSGFIRALQDLTIERDEIFVVGIFKGKLDNKLGEFIKRTSQ